MKSLKKTLTQPVLEYALFFSLCQRVASLNAGWRLYKSCHQLKAEGRLENNIEKKPSEEHKRLVIELEDIDDSIALVTVVSD